MNRLAITCSGLFRGKLGSIPQLIEIIMKAIKQYFGIGISLCLFSANLWAQTRIAILDFELSDVTMAPRIPAELARTASLKPMLEDELARAGYAIVDIKPADQQQANGGFGYLFDHNDSAASLAKSVGADYIMVGRLHKPSFLFAYLMGHLVKADGHLVGSYSVETKGGDKKLTLKAVETFTAKVDADLDNIYTPPGPSKPVH
jgi:Protein of unknown function (DUF2380)